jgi:rRNA maturation RNase YbeY
MPAHISFVNLHPNKPIIKNKLNIKAWILLVIKKENNKAGHINIVITSDKYLLQINKKYLSHNYLTDIISFQNTDNQDISGDLLISYDRIKENAKHYGVKLSDELHRIIIHGILHFLGYNDKTSRQQKQMQAKEDYYLSLRKF